MKISRETLVVDLALCILSQWYTSWEGFKDARSGDIRRKALKAKCWGLVYHDRMLAKRELMP